MIHEINPIQKYTKPFKCCKYILPIFEMICQNNIIKQNFKYGDGKQIKQRHPQYLKQYMFMLLLCNSRL